MITYLKALWHSLFSEPCAKEPLFNAVSDHETIIRKPKKEVSEHNRAYHSANASAPNWTKADEESALVNWMSGDSIEMLSVKLNRSEASIQRKLNLIGMKTKRTSDRTVRNHPMTDKNKIKYAFLDKYFGQQ